MSEQITEADLPNIERTECKGCGRPIIWGITEDGTRIPLDPKPPTYVLEFTGERGVKVRRVRSVLVSHFATCPQASRFSGGGRG
jgi:hypothetical protein